MCKVIIKIVLATTVCVLSQGKSLNWDAILTNEKLLVENFNCLVDKGECNKVGEILKNLIPETLENGCAKCTEEHKIGIIRLIVYLMLKEPEMWKELNAKYDPSGKYKTKYTGKSSDKNINLTL